jgi:hypothetical protein
MLTRPKKLEAVVEKQSTKWHSVKDRFRGLFDPQHIPNVERWYNTIASGAHRTSFRNISKAIFLHQSVDVTADEFKKCQSDSFVRHYGAVLSAEGRRKMASWAVNEADSNLVEKMRDVFSAIQATTFEPETTMKKAFIYRELPDIMPKTYHRQKIDWSSSKTAEMIQKTKVNPMDSAKVSTAAQSSTKRVTKPKSQFDGVNMLDSLGLKTEQEIEELRKNRSNVAHGSYKVDSATGCSMYNAVGSAVGERAFASSRTRIIPTSFGGSGDWISTNRDLIRNPGHQETIRVVADMHPAIARVTASLGLCIPPQPTFAQTM